MADLKSVQIRNGYDELLTKGAGNTVEDGDGVPFDIFNRAFTAGGLVRLPSGINFNASGGDTLDEYEIGTFTPTLIATTTDFESITYEVITDGNYLRLGRQVLYAGTIRTSDVTKGSAAGVVQLSGLPYTALSGPPRGESATTLAAVGASGVWLVSPLSAQVVQGTNNIQLFKRATLSGEDTSSVVDDVATATANRNFLRFSGWYLIS